MSDEPVRFVKGHGTQNDFVLVPDPDGVLDLDAAAVARVCDRHAGLGADGLIRVVRTARVPEVADQAGDAEWFMDYRNADGSTAEMCGNGSRVFVRYLLDAGLVDESAFSIATRGGVRAVDDRADGLISVDMGEAVFPRADVDPVVTVDGTSWPATAVRMPNPHAVVFVDDLAQAGRLLDAPDVSPSELFPDGVNVEFVVGRGTAHIALRVHERGSGETRSCGTGACAAAAAARRRAGEQASPQWRVDVPGGELEVTFTPEGRVLLTGPAVIVATGVLDDALLA